MLDQRVTLTNPASQPWFFCRRIYYVVLKVESAIWQIHKALLKLTNRGVEAEQSVTTSSIMSNRLAKQRRSQAITIVLLLLWSWSFVRRAYYECKFQALFQEAETYIDRLNADYNASQILKNTPPA